MKKAVALLLAALIMLGAGACAADGDVLLGRDEDGSVEYYFQYVFSDGETLYMAGYGDLSTYHVGDEDLQDYEYILPEDTAGNNYDVRYLPFISEGALYAVVLYTRYEDYSEFERAALCALTLDAEGRAAVEEKMPLDWENLVEYYDQSSYATVPDGILAVGGKLLMRCYDSQGNYVIQELDLQTGKIAPAEDLKDIVSMTPYGEDEVLLQQFSYDASGLTRFLVYDPAGESTRLLGEFETEDYNAFQGVVYDAQTDSAYCTKGGEICPLDLASGKVGEGIADMPLEYYGGGACFLQGGYYAFASEGVAVRSLNPDRKAAGRLKIFDSSWSETVNSAYYRFSNAHGDVRTVLSRDYSDAGNVIENMMNRDSNVDIYVLRTSGEYDAVYNRGYMMELDGAENVKAFADSAYPSVRDALSYDGHVVAVPVDVYGSAMGVNRAALERIGLQLSDVPSNWMDFLDFLNTLSGRLGEESGVTLFYAGPTADDMRNQLFYMIFESYQNYVNAFDPTIGYNTELLRGLMARLEAVDFVALGYPREESAEGEDIMRFRYGVEMSEESAELFQIGVGCTFGSFYGAEITPILLSMDADTPAVLSLETTMAFVNPYTQNPQAALEFMNELAADMSDGVKYCLVPTLDTPIRGEYNEKYLQELRDQVADFQAQLAEADAEEKQELEELLRDSESALQEFEQGGWDISRESIDWYRAHDDNLVLARENWLYSENSGEAWDLISEYQSGQITADEMLAGIDKKAQMMLLEGN